MDGAPVIAWACVAVLLILALVAFLCWSIENATRQYDRWKRDWEKYQ